MPHQYYTLLNCMTPTTLIAMLEDVAEAENAEAAGYIVYALRAAVGDENAIEMMRKAEIPAEYIEGRLSKA